MYSFLKCYSRPLILHCTFVNILTCGGKKIIYIVFLGIFTYLFFHIIIRNIFKPPCSLKMFLWSFKKNQHPYDVVFPFRVMVGICISQTFLFKSFRKHCHFLHIDSAHLVLSFFLCISNFYAIVIELPSLDKFPPQIFKLMSDDAYGCCLVSSSYFFLYYDHDSSIIFIFIYTYVHLSL